jgi:hypothetical protein
MKNCTLAFQHLVAVRRSGRAGRTIIAESLQTIRFRPEPIGGFKRSVCSGSPGGQYIARYICIGRDMQYMRHRGREHARRNGGYKSAPGRRLAAGCSSRDTLSTHGGTVSTHGGLSEYSQPGMRPAAARRCAGQDSAAHDDRRRKEDQVPHNAHARVASHTRHASRRRHAHVAHAHASYTSTCTLSRTHARMCRTHARVAHSRTHTYGVLGQVHPCPARQLGAFDARHEAPAEGLTPAAPRSGPPNNADERTHKQTNKQANARCRQPKQHTRTAALRPVTPAASIVACAAHARG